MNSLVLSCFPDSRTEGEELVIEGDEARLRLALGAYAELFSICRAVVPIVVTLVQDDTKACVTARAASATPAPAIGEFHSLTEFYGRGIRRDALRAPLADAVLWGHGMRMLITCAASEVTCSLEWGLDKK